MKINKINVTRIVFYVLVVIIFIIIYHYENLPKKFYDPFNRFIFDFSLVNNGKPKYVSVKLYKYNKLSGFSIKDSEQIDYSSYEFDTNSNIIKENLNWNQATRYQYYDTCNNLMFIKKCFTSTKEIAIDSVYNFYESGKHVVSINCNSIISGIPGIQRFEYDENNKLTYYSNTVNDSSYSKSIINYKIKYNNGSKQKKYTFFDSKGKCVCETTVLNDSCDNILSVNSDEVKSCFNVPIIINVKYKCKYQLFDTERNWIQKNIYIDGVLSYSVYRNIIYW